MYPYPYPDQYEGGSLRSRNGAKYQLDILESLRDLGYGVEFQGWFQSTVSGNYVTTQLVDALVLQQLVNKNAFILIHGMTGTVKNLDLKAIRLTENFVTAYLDGKWKSKDLEAHKLSFLNIFEEIPINVKNQKLIDLYLANADSCKTSSKSSDVLNLSIDQDITPQLLETLYSQIDAYNYDQTNYNYYQRLRQKEQSKITQWKQQRKLENMERAKNGEKELDPEEWHSMFKLPTEPSRYNNMLHSYAIDVLADDVLEKCDEELTKSFAIERKLASYY